MKRAKRLICCCCGQSTKGRQWFNRDTGYGLCWSCWEWIKEKGEPAEEMEQNYGKVGIHVLNPNDPAHI